MSGIQFKDTDKGLKDFKKRLARLAAGRSITLGVHASEGAAAKKAPKSDAKKKAPSKDGQPKKEKKGRAALTVLQIATWQEFGTKTIPARSFVRGFFDEKSGVAKTMMENACKAILTGKSKNLDQDFEKIGTKLAAMCKQRIVAGIEPELAQSTIDAKGSSTPLIDTGQLRSSITYKVRNGTGGDT